MLDTLRMISGLASALGPMIGALAHLVEIAKGQGHDTTAIQAKLAALQTGHSAVLVEAETLHASAAPPAGV